MIIIFSVDKTTKVEICGGIKNGGLKKTDIEKENSQLAMKQYKSIEKGVLKGGIRFEVTYKDYLKFFKKACYYCGITAIGLDRIDSAVEYKVGKVVTCCGICNMMKGSLEQGGFLNHCRRIAFLYRRAMVILF